MIILTSLSFLIPKFIVFFIKIHRKKHIKTALFVCTASRLGKLKLSSLIAFFLLTLLRIKIVTIYKGCTLKKDFDLIVVFGGNTFTLQKWAYEYNFSELIKKTLKKGGVYIGESAGAIILSPSIELAGIINSDKKSETNSNTTGLNIVNFIPLPHYKNRYRNLVIDYEKRSGYRIKTIRNGQFISMFL